MSKFLSMRKFFKLPKTLFKRYAAVLRYHRVRINPPLVSKSANCLVWGSILLKSQTNPDPGFYFLKSK